MSVNNQQVVQFLNVKKFEPGKKYSTVTRCQGESGRVNTTTAYTLLKKNSSISKQADGFDSPAVLLVTSTNNFTKQRKMITPIRVFRPVFGFFFQFALTASGSSLSICFMCRRTSFLVIMPSNRLPKKKKGKKQNIRERIIPCYFIHIW